MVPASRLVNKGTSVYLVSTALTVVPAPKGRSRLLNTGASVHVVSKALSVVPATTKGKSNPENRGHLNMW